MKRLGVALLAGCLTVPSVAGAQTAAPATSPPVNGAGPSDAVRATLPNGMRVVLLPNKLAPVVVTLLAYAVGSDDDTVPGIAHATEHMMFRGTDALSGGQLSDIAARMGAEYNAFTTNEYTAYYYKLPSAYLDVALHIEADRMTHAAIRAADWATERGAIEQEIRAHESVPGYAIGTKLRESFFEGTPFAASPGGTVASFEKMSADEIRAFYKAWYKPSIATLIVAGDIDPTRALVQIHKEFDATPAGAEPERKPIAVPPLKSGSLEATVDYPAGFGALAFRAPGTTDPDYAAMRVIAAVFASGRNRFADLMAEGKVLAAVSLSNAFPEVGASFLLAIPNRSGTPQDAQARLIEVLDAYRKDGIPAELVDAAKVRLLGEQAYRQSSITGLGLAWAEAQLQSAATPDAVYQAIEKVSVDDVNRVFRKYFTPAHQLSLAITPAPTSTLPKVDPSAGVERLGFTPTVHEALPRWAALALNAPLRAPASDAGTVRMRLPNGLRYVLRRESASPTIVLSGVIRNDPNLYVPKGKDGLSLIVSQLLPWGTAKYDRKEFEAEADAIAATATLGTTFKLRVQAKDFERGVALLAEGLLHPAFAPSAFSVVKSQVLHSVAVSNKLPKTKADLAQRLALYPPGDPRRRDVTERTVAAIGLDDVKKYYRFTYRPDETLIAIVGDVDRASAERAIHASFGDWHASGPRPTFRYPALPKSTTKAETVLVKSAVNAQSEVTLKQVFTMRRGDPDYVPLLLANTMLSGEGTGSILFEELRTRYGFVYNASSDFDLNQTGAEFSVSFASDPKNVSRANAAVVAIIKRLQTRPLSAVELQRAKALLLAQRVLPLDSYEGVAAHMVAGAIYGVDSTSEGWFWDALVHTTPAQVQHAMRRIDADRFLRVVVEPGR